MPINIKVQQNFLVVRGFSSANLRHAKLVGRYLASGGERPRFKT